MVLVDSGVRRTSLSNHGFHVQRRWWCLGEVDWYAANNHEAMNNHR